MSPSQKDQLSRVHQWMTVTIIPGLLSLCVWLLLQIYGEYKIFKTQTEEFKQGQVKRDYEQDIKINYVEYRVTEINKGRR